MPGVRSPQCTANSLKQSSLDGRSSSVHHQPLRLHLVNTRSFPPRAVAHRFLVPGSLQAYLPLSFDSSLTLGSSSFEPRLGLRLHTFRQEMGKPFQEIWMVAEQLRNIVQDLCKNRKQTNTSYKFVEIARVQGSAAQVECTCTIPHQ